MSRAPLPVLACLLLLPLGCMRPVAPSVASRPPLLEAEAETRKEGERVILSLRIKRYASEGQWSASFAQGTPEGFRILPGEAATGMAWVIPQDQVASGKLRGCTLRVANGERVYDLEVQPHADVSRVVEVIITMVGTALTAIR